MIGNYIDIIIFLWSMIYFGFSVYVYEDYYQHMMLYNSTSNNEITLDNNVFFHNYICIISLTWIYFTIPIYIILMSLFIFLKVNYIY